MLKFGFEYSFYVCEDYSRNDDPNLLWLIYAYNSVAQTLWLASADKTKSIRSAYGCFQLNSALSMVEVTVLLAV